MSIRSPAPKPAVAPKTEPRRSAIESSVTSTRSALPPNGVYAESTETCTSTATKRTSAALSESRSPRRPRLLRHEHEHGLQRREVDERLHLDVLEDVGVVLARRSSTVPIRMLRGKIDGSSPPPGEPAVMIVSPSSTCLSFADAVEDERVAAAAAVLEGSRPRSGCVRSTARTALLEVGDQHHARDVARRPSSTVPTSPPAA